MSIREHGSICYKEDHEMEPAYHRHDICDNVWRMLEPLLSGQRGQWGGFPMRTVYMWFIHHAPLLQVDRHHRNHRHHRRHARCFCRTNICCIFNKFGALRCCRAACKSASVIVAAPTLQVDRHHRHHARCFCRTNICCIFLSFTLEHKYNARKPF